MKQISSQSVISIYRTLLDSGIQIWIDGGWGVDALLEQQTRPHDDVDIVIQERDLEKFRKIFQDKGYSDVTRDDTSSWNFVIGNSNGHLIDVHVVTFDGMGNGIYGPIENNIMYPASAFKGTGHINGISVYCISAMYQIESHTGYTLRDKDYQDVYALCAKFNIDLPNEYKSRNTPSPSHPFTPLRAAPDGPLPLPMGEG